MTQTHIRSLNRSIKAMRLDLDERYSAVVEVARTLARQMDKAAPSPSTRLVAAYLSSLKDLNRARTAAATQQNDNTTDDFEEYLKRVER